MGLECKLLLQPGIGHDSSGYNSNTREAKAGRSGVQAQSKLRETCFRKKIPQKLKHKLGVLAHVYIPSTWTWCRRMGSSRSLFHGEFEASLCYMRLFKTQNNKMK